jgi:hypothetical protein
VVSLPLPGKETLPGEMVLLLKHEPLFRRWIETRSAVASLEFTTEKNNKKKTMKIKHFSYLLLLGLLASVNAARAHILPCDDFFTGGGFVFGTPSGKAGNFGAHGGIKNGALWGGLNYKDHDTGLHVKSTAVLEYEVISENTRRVLYAVRIGTEAGTAEVLIQDNGEPGANDIFSMLLSTGYLATGNLAADAPGGGNIQLHPGDCLQN